MHKLSNFLESYLGAMIMIKDNYNLSNISHCATCLIDPL